MKKLCAIVVGFVLLSAFYACQKDQLGVYNPKMKLEKVYNEEDEHYLLEQWTWNDNLLAKIDFYRQNGNIQRSHEYIYNDENRLLSIEMDDQHTDFLYEGKLLKTINTYSGDNLVETYDLTFTKDKLSHLSLKKTAKAYGNGGLLSCFLPGNGEFSEICAERGSKAETYNFSNVEADFIWDGDNVSYVKMTVARPDSTQRLTFSYVYDQYFNPKNGFLTLYPDHALLNDQPEYMFCSKNNVKGVMVTDQYDVFSDTESFTYSYEYNNKFPTKVYSTYLNKETMLEDSTLIYTYVYRY